MITEEGTTMSYPNGQTMTDRAAAHQREQTRTRFTEVAGELCEAKGAAELLHERGLLDSGLFLESLRAFDGMVRVLDDLIKAVDDERV
jgi:hypothetical protein